MKFFLFQQNIKGDKIQRNIIKEKEKTDVKPSYITKGMLYSEKKTERYWEKEEESFMEQRATYQDCEIILDECTLTVRNSKIERVFRIGD